MKIKIFLCFIFTFNTNYLIYCNAFMTNKITANIKKDKIIQRSRIVLKTAKKNTYRFVDLVARRQDAVKEKSVSVFNENLINEALYFLKVYHLSNDEINSFAYIVLYELIWFGYKVLASNIDNNSENNDDEKEKLIEVLLLNIMIYILIKNMIVIHLFHLK